MKNSGTHTFYICGCLIYNFMHYTIGYCFKPTHSASLIFSTSNLVPYILRHSSNISRPLWRFIITGGKSLPILGSCSNLCYCYLYLKLAHWYIIIINNQGPYQQRFLVSFFNVQTFLLLNSFHNLTIFSYF